MARHKIWALAALVCVIAGLVSPQAATATASSHQPLASTYAVPGNETFPEGVAFDQRTGFFYVSSLTNGTIFRGHLHRRQLEVFLPADQANRAHAIGLQLDGRGRLYVAGGESGKMFVYDTRTKALIRSFSTGRTDGIINDLAFDRSGDAYFTDSLQPILWRVRATDVRRSTTPGTAEAFMNFTGTVIEYEPGYSFNLNGIVADRDGRSLYTVQSNKAKLFRITLDSRQVEPVAINGTRPLTGDGMARLGKLLLVVVPERNALVTLRLDRSGLAATGVKEHTDPTLRFPTTAALTRDRALVVNSQIDKLFAQPPVPPELPFTVSGVPLTKLIG